MEWVKTKRAVVAAGFGGVALLGLGCWFAWWGRPPQMGADAEVFKTVDALFTAVTARDEKLLGQCEQRLRTCLQAGKLPAEAAAYLESIGQRARAGRWESAAAQLYDFMRAQRREGLHDHASRPDLKRAKGSGH
jgi:hypothetical protein